MKTIENFDTVECLTYSITFNPKYTLFCYISPTLQYKEVRFLTTQKLPEIKIVKLKNIKAKINKPGDFQIETKSII